MNCTPNLIFINKLIWYKSLVISKWKYIEFSFSNRIIRRRKQLFLNLSPDELLDINVLIPSHLLNIYHLYIPIIRLSCFGIRVLQVKPFMLLKNSRWICLLPPVELSVSSRYKYRNHTTPICRSQQRRVICNLKHYILLFYRKWNFNFSRRIILQLCRFYKTSIY